VAIAPTNSGKGLTSIKIRIGLAGDEAGSSSLLDRIKARI